MAIGKKVRAVVAGATGYSGRELIRMLLDHPYIELVGAFASKSADEAPLASVHPHLTGLTTLPCLPYDEDEIRRLEPNVIFLGTPNEFSHDAAPNLLETGAVVVDLSGAYRLRNPEHYPVYYGFEHRNRELLDAAVYGMTEFVRDDLHGAKLVANPGCYPTSIIIPVKPLLDAGLIDVSLPIISDSKSGVTGAGKAPSSTTHFSEVSESLRAYNVFKHRHTPEIAAGLGLENRSDRLTFTPHLLPINRGILSTVYVRLNAGVKRSDVFGVWREKFATSPLVRIFDSAQLPEIKFVASTAYCDIGAAVDESTGQAVIIGAIDNLMKGAASQALQNANLALGFDECAGIRR
jgi:N-acetyl-gamma-glutamyl-phosphate reductase